MITMVRLIFLLRKVDFRVVSSKVLIAVRGLERE